MKMDMDTGIHSTCSWARRWAWNVEDPRDGGQLLHVRQPVCASDSFQFGDRYRTPRLQLSRGTMKHSYTQKVYQPSWGQDTLGFPESLDTKSFSCVSTVPALSWCHFSGTHRTLGKTWLREESTKSAQTDNKVHALKLMVIGAVIYSAIFTG